MLRRKTQLHYLALSLMSVFLVSTFAMPETAEAQKRMERPVVVFLVRHAEKKIELEEIAEQPAKFMEICGDDKCSEILKTSKMSGKS